ncbi:unknown [Clostridium sp. CAG:288]|nr:unknown [Clostridium sp. CAG:288]
MKKNKLFLSSSLLFVSLLAVTSCNGNKKDALKEYTDKIDSSIVTIRRATIISSITESSTLVYEKKTEIEITYVDNEANGSVYSTIKKLGNDFKLVTSNERDSFNGSIVDAKLFNYKIDKDTLNSGYKITEGVLDATVSQTNAKAFLNVTDTDVNGDISFNVVLSEEKITSFRIAYKNISGRDVSISAEYLY